MCGKRRKHLISWRVVNGVKVLGDAVWFIGTYAEDITKEEAVKVQNKFIRWLRQRLGYKVEYVAVWEVHQSGRLHLNLVLAPWRYIDQGELSDAWQRYGGGKVVWIERVGFGIGKEVAKTRQKIANYVAKFDQMVKSGRGVNYSKGWPKLPDRPNPKRKGKIEWRYVSDLDAEAEVFEYELERGYWIEVAPNEYGFIYEECDCFEYEDTS